MKKEKQPGKGPENPRIKTAREGTQEPKNKRAVPTAGKHKEFTKQLSVTAVTKQREEWVQMFQKMFHRVRMWMRPDGPGKTSTQRRKVQNTMVRISSQ